ncbi:zinc finger, CCHC-type containing protein [Tanacetum coccineum]
MECRVESLMRNEVLLYYEGGFTFPKRPYQEEFEGRILKLIDDQEDQIRQLEEDMRKIKDTFMCLTDSLITTLKVKIEAQRAHSIKIKKITTFPTHTPTVTPETLKPAMMNRVSMISKFKPTIYITPHRHLNSNLKMAILHSFEENKLEYEDEDEVEINMMGTGMDKESLEHNLHENDITSIICHNFSPTSNPPIKLKDSGSFRMKIPLTLMVLQEIPLVCVYFDFSLRDQDINWLDRLPAGSISIWDDLTTRFLAQFSPPGRTAKLLKRYLDVPATSRKSLCNAWTSF